MHAPQLAAGLLAALIGSAASAQSPPAQPSQAGAGSAALDRMPEVCREHFQAAPQASWMQNMPMMQGTMPPTAGMPMAQGMGPAGQAYMEGMRSTMPPMMAGMMIKDPDLAFLCSMIPHHQGAIEMSRAALEHGANAEVKAMARKTIEAQEKEIAELTALAEKIGK